MTIGSTFANASSAANASAAAKAVEENVGDAIIGSVISFMSPDQGAGPFYCQLIVLIICTICAIVHTWYKVDYWRDEKVPGDRETVKELTMTILFDTFWPILGVYPSIVVWFDYKVNEKLFTDPLGDIASCMIYVSVTCLINLSSLV